MPDEEPREVDEFQLFERPGVSIIATDRKNAYRQLLSNAVVDIRDLCSELGPISWDPRLWRRHYLRSRDGGAIADWLHSFTRDILSNDPFLNERGFGAEHDRFAAKHPQMADCGYRASFERCVKDLPVDLIFIVGDAFYVEGQGKVLVTGRWGAGSAKKGDFVDIGFVDGTTATLEVTGIVMHPSPAIVIEKSYRSSNEY